MLHLPHRCRKSTQSFVYTFEDTALLPADVGLRARITGSEFELFQAWV